MKIWKTIYMEEHETFWDLFNSIAHWQFEIFLIVLFDGIIGLLIWPKIKKWFTHHEEDDAKIASSEKRLDMLEKKDK